MCRGVKRCVLLGDDPSSWNTRLPLPIPSWFESQLAIFQDAASEAAVGRRDAAVEILDAIRSDDIRDWFDEHGQMSGIHRARVLAISRRVAEPEELDSDPRPTKFERAVFQRDFYTCRYCGLRLVAKEVLVAFERALGPSEFTTKGTNAQQHGVVHAFKIVADHVVPHACGGRKSLENLSACPACNYGKYNFRLEQLGMEDPRSRPPANNDWDGLCSLIGGLKNHALW